MNTALDCIDKIRDTADSHEEVMGRDSGYIAIPCAKEGRQQAFDQLVNNDIEGLVAIGGNGTFTGAMIHL